jgi:hypothetical protein
MVGLKAEDPLGLSEMQGGGSSRSILEGHAAALPGVGARPIEKGFAKSPVKVSVILSGEPSTARLVVEGYQRNTSINLSIAFHPTMNGRAQS